MKVNITGLTTEYKIKAIKFLRDATRTPDNESMIGLKEAKSIIDDGQGMVDIINVTLWSMGAGEFFTWAPVETSSGFIGRVMDRASSFITNDIPNGKVIAITIHATGDNIYAAIANLKNTFNFIVIEEDKK